METMAARFNARLIGDSGHVVVCGHGFGTDQTSWQAQVEALRQHGYRVLVFDFAGASDATMAAYQPARHDNLYGFAEDLVLLLQSLSIRGASYVGHSLGGAIGVLAANGDPGVFDALILLASSARYVDEPQTGYVGGFSREAVDGLLLSMRHDYAAWANGFGSLAAGKHERPTLAVEFTRRLLALRPDVACAVFAAAMHSDLRREVDHLCLPVQVLQTQNDVAVPLLAAQWLAEHSRAQSFEILPTQGHFPQLAVPDRVNDAILHFLDTHAGR